MIFHLFFHGETFRQRSWRPLLPRKGSASGLKPVSRGALPGGTGNLCKLCFKCLMNTALTTEQFLKNKSKAQTWKSRPTWSIHLVKVVYCNPFNFWLKVCLNLVRLKGSKTVETVIDFILGGSKITVDIDCSHEIKRLLLLGRKVMPNLDSILKSRDITLPTKVHLGKAMVLPVVMYGCESWTVKKAEHQIIDASENCRVWEDSWESLGLQGDPTSPS